jgi:hypothetical protein
MAEERGIGVMEEERGVIMEEERGVGVEVHAEDAEEGASWSTMVVSVATMVMPVTRNC